MHRIPIHFALITSLVLGFSAWSYAAEIIDQAYLRGSIDWRVDGAR